MFYRRNVSEEKAGKHEQHDPRNSTHNIIDAVSHKTHLPQPGNKGSKCSDNGYKS